jgi:serine/threonine protein phosphatase PrpC
MELLAHAKSDIGRVREINEDSFVCIPPLFAVADGMGGHVAGEIASRLAIDTISKYFAAHKGVFDFEILLRQSISEANSLVYTMAQSQSGYAGMGTTVTVAYVNGSKIYWGHVGDSRLYLVRGENLIQITDDHSLVGELTRSGTISPQEALIHPQRNILTRAVGTAEYVKVDTGITEWLPGEQFLLCTDGLTNLVRDEDIYHTIKSGALNQEEIVMSLITLANHGGGVDNITAILVLNEKS